MAATAAGVALTERHRQSQVALRALTLRQLLALWPAWDPERPNTWPAFAAATATLVEARRRDSAGLAATYYTTFRAVEGATGAAAPRVADKVDPARLEASIIVTGRAALGRALIAGRTMPQARDVALTMLSGAVTRHTLDGGRHTLIQSVAADKSARGWARVTGGSPCAFCAMLASRGPVYGEESGDFEAHDHCACAVEPVYGDAAAWPPGAQRYADLWKESTAGQSGKDAINAFRRALTA